MLDTLHLYYGGPEPTPIAHQLHAYSRRRKSLNFQSSLYAYSFLVITCEYWYFVFVEMEATRQRVKAAAAHKKDEEKKTKAGESSSTPKAVSKEIAKRKNDRKDDCSSKKASVTAGGKLPKKPSPKKPGAGKGLMTAIDPVSQDSECRLLTHKSYAIKMLESIIKDKDANPCVSQATKELGDSGLFDLARVSTFHSLIYSFSY